MEDQTRQQDLYGCFGYDGVEYPARSFQQDHLLSLSSLRNSLEEPRNNQSRRVRLEPFTAGADEVERSLFVGRDMPARLLQRPDAFLPYTAGLQPFHSLQPFPAGLPLHPHPLPAHDQLRTHMPCVQSAPAELQGFPRDVGDVALEPVAAQAVSPVQTEEPTLRSLPAEQPTRKPARTTRKKRDLVLPASTRKRNREAQQRFRTKQKERQQGMCNELEQLREENAALMARVASLERQISEVTGSSPRGQGPPSSQEPRDGDSQVEVSDTGGSQ